MLPGPLFEEGPLLKVHGAVPREVAAVIELDLETYRGPLASFLGVGTKCLFVPGSPSFVCTTTKERQVFARMLMPGVEDDPKAPDPVMDLDGIQNILKESKVKKMKIFPAAGSILVEDPGIMHVEIGREADAANLAAQMRQFGALLEAVEKADPNVLVHGKKVAAVASFTADREDFLGVLNMVGSPDDMIRIETGESIAVSTVRTTRNRKATYDKVTVDGQASIQLSKRSQNHLRRTLEGTSEKAIRVVICQTETNPYCVFQNNQLSVLAGGAAKKQ